MPEHEITASDERTREFLDVEETARRLAERLSRLDEEANRYAAAGKKLAEAAQATEDLTEVVRSLGGEVARAVEVVASVGGPGIVKHLSALEARESEHSASLLKKVSLAVYLAAGAMLFALAALIAVMAR
jgi:hypothetical protein